MRTLLAATLFFAATTLLSQAGAADWPARPLVIVAPGAAGGTSDIFARLVADGLAKELGAPVIVENRPGAGTLIGSHAVANSTPDGHTLLMAAAAITIGPHLYRAPAIDPLRDFKPIRLVARFPNVVVVGGVSPFKSLAAVIDEARRRPGHLNYASGGVGISEHLSAELFQSMTGTSLTHIPYKSSNDAVMAVASGDAQVSFANLAVAIPLIKSGRLRALAVTGAERIHEFPDLPTVAEAGVAGYDVSTWFGVLAPAGTPTPIVARLDRSMSRWMSQASVRQRIEALAAQPSDEGPEAFTARIKADYEKWGALIQKQNIRAE